MIYIKISVLLKLHILSGGHLCNASKTMNFMLHWILGVDNTSKIHRLSWKKTEAQSSWTTWRFTCIQIQWQQIWLKLGLIPRRSKLYEAPRMSLKWMGTEAVKHKGATEVVYMTGFLIFIWHRPVVSILCVAPAIFKLVFSYRLLKINTYLHFVVLCMEAACQS